MRCTLLSARLLLAGLTALVASRSEAKPSTEGSAALTLNVWPGKPPGDKEGIGAEKVEKEKPGERKLTRIGNVTQPTLTVFRPSKDKDTGASVIIAPGGGYHILAWDLEGEEVAAWLNTLGVTGIVLKYRVPRRPGTKSNEPPPQALMDAQRAVSLVRSKAKEWGLDPQRIGMLGFSAGGHLTAWTATSFDHRAYEPVDDVDRVSCRPDFAVLVYPGYLVRDKKHELAEEIRVSDKTPPTFLAHAGDDPVSPENSIAMYLALKKAGVRAELHVYASGGHGFGLRPSDRPCSHWPERCGEWMKSQKLLEPAPR
jgi:acetyl esterase/lipase